MPGVLKRGEDRQINLGNRYSVMETDTTNMAMEGLKKNLADGGVNGDVYVNGARSLTNGTYTNGADQDMIMSHEKLSEIVEKVSEQLPLEIEHLTAGYLPLSKLIARLAQDTFNGLTEVVSEMSAMQASQQNVANLYSNGIGASQIAQVNVQKKMRMWDFAQDRRAKFIKVLVLSQWSRQAEAVSKVIDLNIWIDRQKRIYNDATNWMGELKRVITPLKVPGPDLKIALEALSTGKASWLPDHGFLPPEPMSPQQLLKSLRTINTLLSIRLNLYEIVPPSFRNFTIASGRATFRVEDEFQLELSIANEDTSSQLFFIDFQFLFSPCLLEIPEGRLRGEIEGKTNDVLKNEGLVGCYDFLHNLVLTHKLSILRHQAFDIARGRWSEDIRVEVVRRSIVIQYWTNRPGGKNWIEIGIGNGRRKSGVSSSSPHANPQIAVRWHRHGKEVFGTELEFSLGELSLETIMKKVIALHTSHILQQTKHKLREGTLYCTRLLSLKRKASATEPADCALIIQLSSSRTVRIVQEPISGAFALIPTSGLNARVERDLNVLRDPAVELASRIANVRCIATQQQIETAAKFVGWELLRTITPDSETMKRLFSEGVARISFFRIKSWAAAWLLASTVSLSGDAWWVVESNKPDAIKLMPKNNPSLRVAFKIPVRGQSSYVIEPSYRNLFRVEIIAAAMISQFIDTRYLAHAKVAHRQQEAARLTAPIQTPTLYIRFLPQQVPAILRSPKIKKKPWCHEIVEILFKGLNSTRNFTYHIVCARLLTPITNIESLTSTLDSSLSFHPRSGALAFGLATPIGTSTVPALLDKLECIERLIHFLGAVEQHNFECLTLSLSRIVFIYASIPQKLKAEVRFTSDAPMRISFEVGNPHLRVQDFLAGLLNSKNGLEKVIRLLDTTLPLLRAFAGLESNCKDDTLHILARSATWYRVRYERLNVTYEVRLRLRRDKAMWYVVDLTEKTDGNGTERLMREMKKLWQGRGEGWRGMGSGIAAEEEGVEQLIGRIDEVISSISEAEDGQAIQTIDVEATVGDVTGQEVETKKGNLKGKEVVVLD